MDVSRRFFGGALLGSAGGAAGALFGRTGKSVPELFGATSAPALEPVSPDDHGARGDAVVLTDAHMSSGSKVLTSATARFSAHDVGKLIHVMAGAPGNAPMTTHIAKVLSRGRVQLAAAAARDVPVLGGPNVNAVYGTDNARAFTAALTAGAAPVQSPVSPVVVEYAARRGMRIGSGAYLVGSRMPVITVPGVGVQGAGAQSSVVYWCGSGALFQLDHYSADPGDAFGGRASGFRLSGLSVINPIERPLSYEGRRRSTAVQDNGSGGAMISDVQFAGLRAGFTGAYGSDFTRIGLNVGFSWCDTGCYFGPGSQQLLVAGTDFFACREGLVLEGAMQISLTASSFEDPLIAAITIEAKPDGRTRSGVPVAVAGPEYAGSWIVTGSWFESNAGRSGRLAPSMIRISGEGPGGVAPTGLAVRDCILVSGGDQVAGASHCFVAYDSSRPADQPVIVDNLSVGGTFINSVVSVGAAAAGSSLVIRDTPLPSAISGTQGAAATVRTTAFTAAARPVATAVETQLVQHDRPGAVVLDAATSSRWAVQLSAAATRTTVVPATPASGLPLTIEWRQDAVGGRSYAWPSNCRFAGGHAPLDRRARSRTSVSFAWDAASSLWFETARAVSVG